ncbi:MAG: hypothetical protein RMJ39_10595 [Deltaproteobacteria bacterium]|nr:hypothetical protein [Deltaproteobacteria bacterium]
MKKTVFDLFPGFFGVFSRYAYPKASKRDMKSLVDSLERDEIVLDLASGTGIPSTFFINKKGLKFVLLDLSINMLRKSPFAASRVVGKAENL